MALEQPDASWESVVTQLCLHCPQCLQHGVPRKYSTVLHIQSPVHSTRPACKGLFKASFSNKHHGIVCISYSIRVCKHLHVYPMCAGRLGEAQLWLLPLYETMPTMVCMGTPLPKTLTLHTCMCTVAHTCIYMWHTSSLREILNKSLLPPTINEI